MITHALSNKTRRIGKGPTVAIAGGRFTAHGKGISPGAFGKEENQPMARRLREVFAEWIDNGHTDLADENTILLRVELTDGVLLSHGSRLVL